MPAEKRVEANSGTTLLDVARENHVPIGSNCGGVCGCSTCHVYIVEGGNSLDEMEDKEIDRLDLAFDVRLNSRLACQVEVGEEPLVVELSAESLKAFLDEHPTERKYFDAYGCLPKPYSP